MDDDLYGKRVHIWTDEEILALPTYHTWFYGMCLDEESGEIVISEISPSLGRSSFSIYKDDGDRKPVDPVYQYAEITYDFLNVTPEYLAQKYPNTEKVDWEEEIAEAKLMTPLDLEDLFQDDRSLFLKLMDSRYLLDFFMDNQVFSYSKEDIEEHFDDYEEDLSNLLSFGIIEEHDGKYCLSHSNALTDILISLDRLLGNVVRENVEQNRDNV